MFNCPKCKQQIPSVGIWQIGLRCPYCGAELELNWDYTGEEYEPCIAGVKEKSPNVELIGEHYRNNTRNKPVLE